MCQGNKYVHTYKQLKSPDDDIQSQQSLPSYMASFILVTLRTFDYLGCYLHSYLAPVFLFIFCSFEFYLLTYIKQALTAISYLFILSFIQYNYISPLLWVLEICQWRKQKFLLSWGSSCWCLCSLTTSWYLISSVSYSIQNKAFTYIFPTFSSVWQ